MALKNTHKYDDIIHLPHPVPQHRAPMTNYDRAAQFAPFAALTGYEDAIQEAGRLTDARMELDEDAKAALDETLARIREELPNRPQIEATWFVYDEWKAGGRYVSARGRAKHLDEQTGTLLLAEGTWIPLKEIFHLRILPQRDRL